MKSSGLSNSLQWPLLLVFAVAAGLWFLGGGSNLSGSNPENIYSSNEGNLSLKISPDSNRVELRGFSQEALQYLEDRPADLSGLLSVYALSGASGWSEDAVPTDGSWSISDESIVFRPRHAWLPEVEYYVRIDRNQLHTLLGQTGSGSVIDTSFTIPRPENIRPEEITGVYPSADTLPQNLLKFYIQFSGSMARGESYEHIYILNEDGEVVPDAFLELPQELWDPQTTRLTILFDPGRIKRGLERHNMMGVAFEPGKEFTLVVDSTMVDGNGQPIGTRFEKTFHITEPDREMPDHKQWTINTPEAESWEPLELQLNEPMDHALLQGLIKVKHEGNWLFGKVETDKSERLWRFIPDEPWQAGQYTLEIEPVLEDLAGNNLISVFDVDLADSTESSITSESQTQHENPSTITKKITIQFPG